MLRNWKQICVGLAAVGIAGGAFAQDTRLTIIHGSPSGHPITRAVETWMECIQTTEGPQADVSYYPGGQISGIAELLQGLNNGVGHAAPIAAGYVSEKLPLNGVVMLPGLGSTAQEVMDAYGAALESGPLREEFLSNGVVPIWVMAWPPYQIMSTSDPITSAEDFSGKVVRSAGGTMNLTIESLGAAPAEITIGDVYVAMERGTADATISSFSSIRSYGLAELASSVSFNASFGTFTNVFVIDQDKWTEFSPEMQDKAMACGETTETAMAAFLDAETDELAAEFKEQGIDVYNLSDPQLDAFADAMTAVSNDWADRLEKRGLPARQVLEDYTSRFGGTE
ncbi:MAG: TRAP transporter substrate-binding protein DctP [Roseovarius sp.]